VIWAVLLFMTFVRCNADPIDIVECQCHIFFNRDEVFVVKILNKTVIQFSYQDDYIDQKAATAFTLSWLFGITSYASFTKWNQGKHKGMSVVDMESISYLHTQTNMAVISEQFANSLLSDEDAMFLGMLIDP